MMFYQMLVLALTVGLGGPKYKTRETCQRALIGLNNTCDLRLVLKPFLAHPDPEVASRVGHVLSEYECVYEGLTQVPRLDSLIPEWAGKAYDELSRLCGGQGATVFYLEDEQLRQATIPFVSSLLEDGYTRQWVRQRLLDAAAREGISPCAPPPREVRP
jgi:hypothetical protein